MTDDVWVGLSLFYVLVPREDSDPSVVEARAQILYGEGGVVPKSDPPVRDENLGDGIRLLRVSNRFSVIAEQLTKAEFDYRKSGSRTIRFVFGFLRRPVVLGLADGRGGLASPLPGVGRLQQFVRIDKAALLNSVASGFPDVVPAQRAVTTVFELLRRKAGVNLRDANVQWVGDVVVGWPRTQRTASWEPVWGDGKSCRALDVTVVASLSSTIFVHVRVEGVDGMCICDRVLSWAPGDGATKRVDLQEELTHVALKAWVDDALVFTEQRCLLRGMSTTVRVVAASFTIRDRLTQKLAGALGIRGATSALLARAQTGTSTGFSTTVASKSGASHPWAGLNRARVELQYLLPPTAPDYTHFPTGAEGRAEAVLRFGAVISSADDGYLVDPWFDELGAEALLTRVQGDVRLTVLTNLASSSHLRDRQRLVDFLTRVSAIGLPTNLRVVLATDNNKQVFHDRFLLLQKGDQWTGYVLTNSFSGLASNYPLYVVETPAGTTALLLAEAERLVGIPDVSYEQLWPPVVPSRSVAARRSRPQGTRWRRMLHTIVPVPLGHDAKRLRLAETRGFLVRHEEGVKWLMSDQAYRRALDWALAKKPLSPIGLRRRRFGSRGAVRAAMGDAVMMLGELAAAGLAAKAWEVAARLNAQHSLPLQRALRCSFRESFDPSLLEVGSTPQRLALRQLLSLDAHAGIAFRNGVALWGSRPFEPGGTGHWDRCFAYAVLLYLDPPAAVRACEQLADADMIFAMAGLLHHHIEKWSGTVAAALANARSPVLRGFGAQAIAHMEISDAATDGIAVPKDIGLALQRFLELEVPHDGVALCLCSWGTECFTNQAPEIADALVATLRVGSLDLVQQVCDVIFETEPRSRAFVQAVVEVLAGRPDAFATNALEVVLTRFGGRFRDRVWSKRSYGVADFELMPAMSLAVRVVAAQRGTSCSSVIESVVDLTDIEREVVPLTPLRARPDAGGADVALGWVRLWETMANGVAQGSEEVGAIPPDVAQRANAYLGSIRKGQSEELREALRKVLVATSALDPQTAPEGIGERDG